MSAAGKPNSNPAGFAIVIVLWVMVLMSLLVLHIEQVGRGESELALNLRQAACLQAQADGAISIAAFHLLSTGADAWHASGKPYVIEVGNDAFTRRITVRIENQAGKIDINTASAVLLSALAVGLGSDPSRAGSMASNILAWRSPSGAGPATEAVSAPYKRAGCFYGPPGGPFESIDELRLVLGVKPQLLALIAPELTIFYQGSPQQGLADAVVAHAMAVSGNALAQPSDLPLNGLQVVQITATAAGDGDASFTRQAILRLGRQKEGWMYKLTWTAPPDQNVSN